MHKILFNGFHLQLIHSLCTELHLQSDLFFIYKEHYSLLLRLLRHSLLHHLLPRTTFVREEASHDEALRTTKRRAWKITF